MRATARATSPRKRPTRNDRQQEQTDGDGGRRCRMADCRMADCRMADCRMPVSAVINTGELFLLPNKNRPNRPKIVRKSSENRPYFLRICLSSSSVSSSSSHLRTNCSSTVKSGYPGGCAVPPRHASATSSPASPPGTPR